MPLLSFNSYMPLLSFNSYMPLLSFNSCIMPLLSFNSYMPLLSFSSDISLLSCNSYVPLLSFNSCLTPLMSVNSYMLLSCFNSCMRLLSRAARLLIDDYLDKVLTGMVEEVALRGDDRPPGLLKALLLNFGDDLDTLRNDTGLNAIAVDYRWWVGSDFVVHPVTRPDPIRIRSGSAGKRWPEAGRMILSHRLPSGPDPFGQNLTQ